MPGVPTSRGCEACRKQKKKCDQSKPTCSRCTRLNIACVGCGERRFKFRSFGDKPSRAHFQKSPPSRTISVQEVIRSPSSETTMMTGAFCYALKVNDARYDLSVYGPFLKDIPRRLGSSAALDASVNALTTAFSSFNSRVRSPEVYESYVQALKTLRVCLDDPKEAGTANTMCAIYLMTVCQGWIGQKDDCTGHGEAMSYLLYNAVSQGWQNRLDSFESDLIVCLCVVVIMESICNPKVNIGPWLWKLTKIHDKTFPIESLKLGNLAKLPGYIHHPEDYQHEMKSTYKQLKIDMVEVLKNTSAVGKACLGTLHVQCQAACCILLTFAIILNTILRTFDDHESRLFDESDTLVDEAISLAENATQYRPLGSSSMPLCLVSALAATNDATKRIKLDKILAEYQSDFAIARWMDLASWLKVYLTKDHAPLSESPGIGGWKLIGTTSPFHDL